MSTSPGKLLLAIALMVVALFAWSHQRTIARHDPRHSTGTDGMVVLKASWCGYCQRLESGLKRAGVPYQELDIEESSEGEYAFAALHARAVPVMVIGQDVVYGYDTQKLGRLLADRGYRVQFE